MYIVRTCRILYRIHFDQSKIKFLANTKLRKNNIINGLNKKYKINENFGNELHAKMYTQKAN